MLSKRSLATGQRWLRELAIEAESKTGVLVDVFGSEMTGAWDKKQYEAVQEAAFRRGQAVAYSRAADLIGEYFRSPKRKAPTCLELPFCDEGMDCHGTSDRVCFRR